MDKSILEEVEKSGCFRWIVVVGAIVTILSGIGTVIQGDTSISIGGVFCTSILAVLVIGLMAAYSVRSISSGAREELISIRTERALKDVAKDGTEKHKPVKAELSASKIGFLTGVIYGSVLGVAIVLLGEGDILAGIFLGGMVAFFAGIIGIVPAHIGWYWPNSDQAKRAGIIVAGIIAVIALSLLSSEPSFGIWVGLFLAPSGWLAASAANSYRFPKERERKEDE